MSELIYKICTDELWSEAMRRGALDGAPIDLADGFIHFSTANQVKETAARHFSNLDGLVLAAIVAERLGDSLRFEPARGGELFPHLYGALSMAAVHWVVPLPLGPDGVHIFPPMDG